MPGLGSHCTPNLKQRTVRRQAGNSAKNGWGAGEVAGEHPTIMRLLELQGREKIATVGKLNVVLGEK